MRKYIVVAGVLCALIGTVTSRGLGQGNNQPLPERFVLSGVILFDGGPGFAWLQEPNLNGGRPVVLRPGESIGPYRLAKVFEDWVELEGPTGTVRVPLRAPATAVASIASSLPAPVGSPRMGAVPTVSSPGDVASGMQPEAARALRERLEELSKQYQQPQTERAKVEPAKAERQQAREPKAERRSAGQTSSPEAAATNPPANNSKAIFLESGDPRLKQSFQSMIGVGK